MAEGNEILNTCDIAQAAFDPDNGPEDVQTDMVATKAPEGVGIEFHVSMRDYTLRDMEELIVEAAARMLVGRHNDHAMAKKIEERCIDLITKKADSALANVTAEIIDQPITPKYAFVKPTDPPVTMRELIGLTGRDYLTARVDHNGKTSTDRYHDKTRIQYLVDQYMGTAFKREIEKATNAAIAEVRRDLKFRHDALLAAEMQRFRDAMAHTLEGKK